MRFKVRVLEGELIVFPYKALPGNDLTAATARWGIPYHRTVKDSRARCETYLRSHYLVFGGSVSMKIDSTGDHSHGPESTMGEKAPVRNCSGKVSPALQEEEGNI
jgi:hypothetical protein